MGDIGLTVWFVITLPRRQNDLTPTRPTHVEASRIVPDLPQNLVLQLIQRFPTIGWALADQFNADIVGTDLPHFGVQFGGAMDLLFVIGESLFERQRCGSDVKCVSGRDAVDFSLLEIGHI